MPDEAQIGCYLSRDDAQALTKYALSLDIRRPTLLALLIVRAVRADRLAHLNGHYAGSEPKRGSKRVTVRIMDKNTKRGFTAAAKAAGLGTDDAAAMVFRAELIERWMEGAVQK